MNEVWTYLARNGHNAEMKCLTYLGAVICFGDFDHNNDCNQCYMDNWVGGRNERQI